MTSAQQQAQLWLAQDPDSDTQAELAALLEANAPELQERFASTLEFGTAGLRGVLGAGPSRMNRVLVQKVSAGLAHCLVESVSDARARGVVIGYDGRHKSRIFAEDTAAVLLGKGFKVYLSTTVVPTPVVAFGVLDCRAAAGIMVTASHNPPEYNGYKVYWGNGAQIIAPQDTEIADAFAKVGRVDELELGNLDSARKDGRLVDIDDALLERYYVGVQGLAVHPEVLPNTPLKVAYTPMHGVGGRFVKDVLQRAGVAELHIEPSQAEPDGDFPTVRFPNPEEKGAMDRVFALGQSVGADLILANDPDADRLAVALPTGDGSYQMLSGDQVGVLLADYLLTEGASDDARMVATTIVSSQLLALMAKAAKVDYRGTLTGFKWIANAAIDARGNADTRFVVGYEEALGYSVGELVRDKDGVSAAMLFCELAAFAKSQGSSVWARLDDLYRKFGVFQSKQVSLVLPGTEGSAKIAAIMQSFRTAAPSEIGGYRVVERQDLELGEMGLPASNVLIYMLEGNRRIIMRPSGTEPKLKCYYEVREEVAPGESIDEAVSRAQAQMSTLVDAHQSGLSS